MKDTLLSLDYSFKENELLSTMRRSVNFPHKVWLTILYEQLLNDNKEVGVSDFKVFFFDLVNVLIRDKSILADNHDSRANYNTTRRFKIKRVERLFLV